MVEGKWSVHPLSETEIKRLEGLDRVERLLKERNLSDLKLDVGAGDKSSDPHFLTVDLFTEADINATMWDIPLPEDTVDAIFSSNALEHIPKVMVVPTLKEWHRLLRPGGKMQFVIPDLEWACRWWLEHQTNDWNMDILYGHQKHDGEYHKTGFNTRIIYQYLIDSADWYIRAIYYTGGSSEFQPKDGGLVEHVEQRLIVVEAMKKYEGFKPEDVE